MKIINVNIRNLRCYVIKYIKLEPRVRISNNFQSNFPRETLNMTILIHRCPNSTKTHFNKQIYVNNK